MLYFLRKGVFLMKIFVWAYRILLGLFLLAILVLLAAEGLAACWTFIGEPILLWFIDLYPPYSGYLLLGGLLIVGIWVMLSTAINVFRTKRKPSEPLTEMLADTEVSAVFQQLAEQCGVTLAEGDSEFHLAFQNPNHAIWCVNDGDEFIVGLIDSPHHEHFDSMKAAQKEIEDICAEKIVQMIFFDAKGEAYWNDLYSTEDLDAEVFARFHPLRAPQAWWARCLRIIFLILPPFTPQVVRAEIYSYRGTYDRKVFRE